MTMPHAPYIAHIEPAAAPQIDRRSDPCPEEGRVARDAVRYPYGARRQVMADQKQINMETPKLALPANTSRPSLCALKPLQLKSPDVMSQAELAAWAQVGKNAIPRLLAHFAIREITGKANHWRYSTHDIFRMILGTEPQSAEDVPLLLKPLQTAGWVEAITGISRSTLSTHARRPFLGFPAAINLLTTRSDQAAARGRRWIPAQIEAHIRGEDIPFLAGEIPPSNPSLPPDGNVFAAICASNAEGSR